MTNKTSEDVLFVIFFSKKITEYLLSLHDIFAILYSYERKL